MTVEQRVLPLFPLNVVLFPGMVLPLHIFEERYKLMMGTCMVSDQLFGVSLIRDGEEVGAPAVPYETGTIARITRLQRLPDGRMNLIAVGETRFRLLEEPRPTPYLVARVQPIAPVSADLPAELARSAHEELTQYLALMGREAPVIDEVLDFPAESLSYQAASVLRIEASVRQQLLEMDDPIARLQTALTLLRQERAFLKMISESSGKNDSIGPFSVN
ncbi:MAG: LON peptidase substrate-binding domain-containing protein [Chloroflexota bacterium]